MENRINLDELINKMNNAFPNERLTEMEKVRYLYIELGKLLKYDINYISASERKSEDIYWKNVDFDNIETNECTCRQISDTYAELLKRAGINAESVWKPMIGDDDDFDPTFRHKYTVVTLSDGRKFIADLIFDLPFLQKGIEPMFFGTTTEELLPDVQKIDKEEVKNADIKFGYSYPKDLYGNEFVYIDNFIQLIKDDMDNEEHLRDYVSIQFSEEEARNIKQHSLIKYKLDIISKFFTVSEMGFREGRTFLEKVFLDLFTEEEKKQISMHDLITEYETFEDGWYKLGKTDMMKCFVWKKGDKDYEYYLYECGKNLRKVEKDEIVGLMDREKYRNLSRYNKIPGIEDDDIEK